MLQLKFLFKKCSGLKYGLTGLHCVTTADFFQGKKKYLPRSVSHDFQSNFSIQSKSCGHTQLEGDGLQLYRVPKRNMENSSNNQQTMKGPRTVPGVQ